MSVANMESPWLREVGRRLSFWVPPPPLEMPYWRLSRATDCCLVLHVSNTRTSSYFERQPSPQEPNSFGR